MQLIKSNADLILEADPLRRIERIGRMCYKSEDKITEDSAQKFVGQLIQRQHFAMLEHARVTFEVKGVSGIPAAILNLPAVGYTFKGAVDGVWTHYLTLSCSHIFQYSYTEELPTNSVELFLRMFYITFATKYLGASTSEEQSPGCCSVALEDNSEISVKLIVSPKDEIVNYDEADHAIHDYYSIHFLCDRGVSHELVRHRAGVAQESTRYCNYAMAKFHNEIVFIEPSTWNEWDAEAQFIFKQISRQSEQAYMTLVNEHGLKPQQARAVLTNALKTEVVLTMPVWQCRHFFNLRKFGTTGAPHPDMQYVAEIAYDQFSKEEEQYDKYFAQKSNASLDAQPDPVDVAEPESDAEQSAE